MPFICGSINSWLMAVLDTVRSHHYIHGFRMPSKAQFTSTHHLWSEWEWRIKKTWENSFSAPSQTAPREYSWGEPLVLNRGLNPVPVRQIYIHINCLQRRDVRRRSRAARRIDRHSSAKGVSNLDGKLRDFKLDVAKAALSSESAVVFGSLNHFYGRGEAHH